MTVFWTIVSFMLVMGVALVAPALLKQRKRATADRKQQNIQIARERMRELDAEHARGELDKAAYDFALEEIEQSLLDDVVDENTAPTVSTGFGRVTLIVIALAMPVAAISLYHALGSPMAVSMSTQQASAQQQSGANSMESRIGMSMDEAAVKLADKLKQEPDNSQGWYLLGQTYMSMRKYKEAAAAFSHSYKLEADNPKIMLRYADALAMSLGGRMQGEPFELIKKAIKLMPNDVTALWLAGMGHAEAGEYQKAIDYWRRVEPMVASEPESLKDVQTMIANAQQALGIPVAQRDKPVQAVAPVAAKTSNGIRVSVSLDPSMLQKAQPDDTVFVYAKAASGPPMPLAVARKKVRDLPLTVTLNDEMAMMPQMKLSNFAQVRIGARISKSGNAIAQSGDLEGDTKSVESNTTETVKILIKHRRP